MMKLKLVSLFALILAISGLNTHAQDTTATCSGRNIYAELQKSDPINYAAIEKTAKATLNEGPLYWKITPPNGAKPSYLLGTAHVTDDRIAIPSDRLEGRIRTSRVAVFELAEVANTAGMAAAMMSDKTRTLMPEGQSLWDVVPDEQEATIKSNPMIAKIPAEFLDKLQPWLVMTMLTSPLCEQTRQQVKFTLDAALAQRAQIHKVDIEGLETIKEQLAAISSLSLKEQGEMLASTAALDIPPEDIFQTLVELYLSEQVTAMDPLMKVLSQQKGLPQKPSDAAFAQTFIIKRNHNMAERSKSHIDKGAAFIAVGALHLYGEEGVVELLRKAGYQVTAEK